MKVNSVDFINLQKSKKLKSKDNFKASTKNFDEKSIFDYLNFTSLRTNLNKPVLYKVPKENLKDETALSSIAREMGVNTPEIDKDGNYQIRYNKADYKKNSIRKGHIQKVLDNIFLMDKAGLMHGDVEIAHVFYSKNSNDVEFDCFRFGYNTQENEGRTKWEFAPCEYPSNIKQFENNCIGAYLDSMDNKEDKNDFIKMYLSAASKFHLQRAQYLEQTNKGDDIQIEYEKAKSRAYKNPDDTLIELFKQRVEMEYKQRQYFTDWDEGFMDNDEFTPDESRTVKSVLGHFDSIQNGINYYNAIEKAEEEMQDLSALTDYLNFEKEYAKHFINNRITQLAGGINDDFQGMAFWTLNPDNKVNKTHVNVPEDEKVRFNKMLKKLKETPYEEKTTVVSHCKEQYERMLKFR